MIYKSRYYNFRQIIKMPYSEDDAIKNPSLRKNPMEGFIVEFNQGKTFNLYDSDKDARLAGNEELKKEIEKCLEEHPARGKDYDIYNPDSESVTLTIGELKALAADPKAAARIKKLTSAG